MNDDELKRTLAKLQADYAAQVPATVAQMEELGRRLVAAELAPLRLADLARMAHSIGGSASTFGVPDASQAARELELFLDPFAHSGRLPGAAEQTTIALLLAALRQAAIQR